MIDRSCWLLFIVSLISGCTGSSDNRFEYPDTEDVELHLTVADTYLVIEGHRLFRQRESLLLVKVLDKDFSVANEANLECVLHNKGRQVNGISVDQLSPGNFKVTVKPTWAGQGTMTLKVTNNHTDAVFKLQIMVNQND